jgi:hypothetical protein
MRVRFARTPGLFTSATLDFGPREPGRINSRIRRTITDHENQQYRRASASGRYQRWLSARGNGHGYRRRAVGDCRAQLQSCRCQRHRFLGERLGPAIPGRASGCQPSGHGPYGQPRAQAASNLRNYFTAHPQEYYDLRGILVPIGDTERQCNVTALPPNLESAYQEFMAG